MSMPTPNPSHDAVSSLPADLEHAYTPLPRPRLHYVAAGAGKPVVLLRHLIDRPTP